MIRRLSAILILVVAFSAASAGSAHACSSAIPVLGQVCKIVGDNTFLDAVVSRIQIYVETMLYTLKIESQEKYAKSVSLLEQRGSLAAGHRQDQREHMSAVPGERCVLPSEISAALRGGVITPPSLTGPNPTPSSMRTPEQRDADARAAAGSRPALPAAVDANGFPQPVGVRLATASTGGYDPQTFRNRLGEQHERVMQDRRQNMPPALYGDSNRATLTDYYKRQSNYGPNQPVEQFRSADITASTILMTDTFPPTPNQPTPGEFKVGDTTVKLEAGTMKDAAHDYCKNLVDPTLLDPNRGAALGQDLGRKSYAVQRAGWESRQSLASTICNDMVEIRTGKTNEGSTGLIKIALELRDRACHAAEIKEIDKKYLNCSSANPQFSEFELMRILYSALLPSLQGAKLIGAAGNNDMMSNLLSVDQMALTLNFRIYELQEKLNLIKAAQLAQLVENSKTGPGASAAAR